MGVREGLPAPWYYDPGQFDLELQAIWSRQWLAIGRATDWPRAGDWRRVTLGDQQILVTRDRDGAWRAFHNTCRHRGSQLCAGEAGRFPAGRIVCPYHAWAYSLDGELLATPLQDEAEDFRRSDFPLYAVAVASWGGFVFINLAAAPAEALAASMLDETQRLSAWPLHELALAHREVQEVACNWKIFWENYQECYHCSGIHPELSRLVPLYGQGLVRPEQLPAGHPLRQAPVGLRPGAVSWTSDGATSLPDIAGLGPAQLEAGMTFADFLPGMFVIAHRDYVRSVRVWPLAPERTRLTVDWLLPANTLAMQPDLERLVSFARQVVAEDARACEINQGGLRSRAHRHGVLLPIEDGVAEFDDWVRAQLPRTAV